MASGSDKPNANVFSCLLLAARDDLLLSVVLLTVAELKSVFRFSAGAGEREAV